MKSKRKGTMIKIAILVFVLIVIAVAIFYVGVCIGSMVYGKRFAEVIGIAIAESDLTSEQKIRLLDNIEKKVKNGETKGIHETSTR
jgi:hypothetical protein